jgi:hypothetical protein
MIRIRILIIYFVYVEFLIICYFVYFHYQFNLVKGVNSGIKWFLECGCNLRVYLVG